MRQVPHYLLLGNGRVAQHFQHYFSLLNFSFTSWHRKQPIEILHNTLNHASHILLLISDDSIESFIQQYLKKTSAKLIHFSGSLVTPYATGAHPLMSFSKNLYDLAHYQSIPFIVDHDAAPFETLLPGLSNSHFRMHTSMKAKYHALCVLSGNFSCLLWQKLFRSLEKEFHIPAKVAFPYLKQQTHNLIADYNNALTGPLVRNDKITLKKNQRALQQDVFHSLFQQFVNCYQKLKREENWL